MSNPISNLTSSLSARDRRFLSLALPLIVILVVALGGRALARQHQQAESRLNRVLEDIAWLQAQSAMVPQQGRQCPAASWNPKRLSALASRYGVTLASTSELQSGMLQLTVAESQGNGVLEFIQILECQGATVADFELVTLSESGSVRGNLVAVLP